jgi:hypothetical protein
VSSELERYPRAEDLPAQVDDLNRERVRAESMALLADARNSLERARSLEDVKHIHDQVRAYEQYAKAQKLGEDAIRFAQETVMRALRRMGEIDETQPRNPGGRPTEKPVPARNGFAEGVEIVEPTPPRTAADLGISRKLRMEAVQMASIPEAAFEDFLGKNRDLSKNKAMRHVREWKADQRRAEYVEPTHVIGDYDIRHGDLRECLSDLDGTVDAIITDPPYPKEYIPLYEDLSLLANRVLKPKTGILVVMAGHIWLPEIMALLGKHMRYRWVCAYLTLGAHSRVWGAHVNQGWKPVLLYRHPDSIIEDLPIVMLDVFKSEMLGAEGVLGGKSDHKWQQDIVGMKKIVEYTSKTDHLVLDPFLGAGTTGVACVDLKRRFVGCDVDTSCVEVSRERIASRLNGEDVLDAEIVEDA